MNTPFGADARKALPLSCDCTYFLRFTRNDCAARYAIERGPNMNTRWINILAGLVLLLFLGAPLAWAQVSTSSITGTVADPSGALIPNAKVTAINEATGVQQLTKTTSSGLFSFPSVVPGAYTIEVEAKGFDRYVGKGNILTVGQPLVVNVKLQVGSTTTTVEVQGSYERLQTTNATLGDVIDRQAIQSLPLNGGNPLNLVALEPGLVQRSNGGAGSDTHVNGSRDRAYNVTLDGIDINEPSVPNPQSNVFRLNADNVQEYRVVTQDPTPEFGRNSGANISIGSRSGTSEFHGTVYDIFRNPALDANEWFANDVGLPKDQLRLNQYGADVGGPIVKDKTFFFASWEGQRLSDSASIANALGGVPRVYTSTARGGVFRYVVGTVTASNGQSFTHNSPGMVDAQGNLLPGIMTCNALITTNCIGSYDIFANDPSMIGEDTVMGNFINAEPLPNDFTHGDGVNIAGFQWTPSFNQPEARWLARVDEHFNDSNSLFVRYLIDFADTLGGDFLNGRPRVFPGFPPLGEVSRRPSNLAVSYRHVFSPQLVNEFTAGYGRFLFDFLFGRANPAFPNIPPFAPSNFTSPFLNQSGTARWLTTRQFIDNLTYTHAAHTFSAGINFRFIEHNDQRSFVGGVNNAPRVFFSGSGRPPTANFNTPANISSSDSGTLDNSINEFLGIPSSETQAFFSSGLSNYTPSGLYVRGARFHQYDLYGQDEWKWRSNLTVTYGARYELNMPATEANNLILGPNQPFGNFSQTGPLTFVPKSSFWSRDNALSIAPRVGVAWQPFANGRTVVRAGYGIAFDTVSTFQFVPVLGLVPGSSAGCALTISDVSNGSGGFTPTPSSNCAIPNNADQRIAGGFPLTLPTPSSPPSAFTTPPVASKLLATFAGAVDPNLKNPAVYEWDLSIEHDLGKKIVFEADYVGKRGTHLLRAYDLNQLKINHDGFLQDFAIARSNLLQCSNPNGTSGCGQTVPLLPGLFGGTIPTTGGNGRNVATDLEFNAAGALASLIDSNFFSSMDTSTGRPDFFRPNPQFNQVFWLDSGGDSYYHGLQLQVRRHETNVDFGGAYTFAKSIDDMSVDPVGAVSGGAVGNNSRTPTDIYDFRIDRGRSDFDRTQVFTGYVVWNLPLGRGQRWASRAGSALDRIIGGWSASTIVTAMSGEPFSVLSGRLTNSDIRFSRADIVGRAPSTGLFFNVPAVTGPLVFNFTPGSYITTTTSANLGCLPMQNGSFFCTPPPGSDGTQGRNIFNGPMFANLDLSLSKQFAVSERWKLQFRSDFFNAFNHPNFDNPLDSTDGSESITSGGFGQSCCVAVSVPTSSSVISVGEPYRVIQFALRLSF